MNKESEKLKKPKNPKAFPTASATRYQEGMSLRDYFAGLTLQGILANPADDRKSFDMYAERAYKMADAMLKQRKL